MGRPAARFAAHLMEQDMYPLYQPIDHDRLCLGPAWAPHRLQTTGCHVALHKNPPSVAEDSGAPPEQRGG
jgi:hypothetical protein